MKLHIGCGTKHIDGFWNIDIVPVPRVDEVTDGTNLLTSHPQWINSIELIACFHVFEHFAHQDAVRAASQWFELLKPGGQLVLEMPDFFRLCEMTTEGDDSDLTLAYIFGCQDRDGQFHKWGWGKESISKLLVKVGFSKVEFTDPIDYHAKERPCFRVEATKL